MGSVFAAVVVPVPLSGAAELAQGSAARLKFNVKRLSEQVTVFISEAARIDSRDVTEVTAFAATISHQMPALFIIYDDRTSTRISARYDGGILVRTFGPEDERFVPLLPDGEPGEGPVLTASQLDPEAEYETVVNAIELGLRDLGWEVNWRDLLA